jgi:hypothetical protein
MVTASAPASKKERKTKLRVPERVLVELNELRRVTAFLYRVTLRTIIRWHTAAAWRRK